MTIEEPADICSWSSADILKWLAWCFTVIYEKGDVSDSFVFSWDPFPHPGLPRPALIWGEVPSRITTSYNMCG